jgi:hypothetical protein
MHLTSTSCRLEGVARLRSEGISSWLARKGTGSQKWGRQRHPSRSQQLGMVIGWELLREGPKWPLRFALAPKCCRARTWVMWIEVARLDFQILRAQEATFQPSTT